MKSSNIGGQAVIEGVMMKNKDRYAVAVRKPDGEIEVTTDTYKRPLPIPSENPPPLPQIYLCGKKFS